MCRDFRGRPNNNSQQLDGRRDLKLVVGATEKFQEDLRGALVSAYITNA
jgi:hypothetical protein